MRPDIEIAQAAPIRRIREVAEEAGLLFDEVESHGPHKAKVTLGALDRLRGAPDGRYVVVTAVTPTPLGEGKTLTTVGLGQALRAAGHRAFTCIRQPSLGPVFGLKGGAAGGGMSQVIPMADLNLRLTGDFDAVSAAHNLCAAFVDNRLHHGECRDVDPRDVVWNRVLDISDRALRDVVVGLGGASGGIPRETSFDITAASELMAILALAEDLTDLRARLGRVVVAFTRSGDPVTAEDIGVAGAMAVLMKDTIKPNLLQNLEGGPVFVHAGPFANIAHGNSSIVADRLALKLADYVVTESGFGADMGFEKFCNVKCRVSGLRPDCAVMVCTVRALKSHSGRYHVSAGEPLDPALAAEDLDALGAGSANLVRQIANVKAFGVPLVVVVNSFATDTPAEHALIRDIALAAGADFAVVHDMHASGGMGGIELAEAVVEACELPREFRHTYADDEPIAAKIERIATEVYGAEAVYFRPAAQRHLEQFTRLGYAHLPVCMAKTQLSLSHDPALKGAPSGWRLPVEEIRLSAGAGFLYALCGGIMTMPGLPARPAGERIDIDATGGIVGLF